MGIPPKIGTVTYEEWLEMPVTQEGREEVVNGEIRVMPPNKLPHAVTIDNLTAAFHKQLNRTTTRFFASVFGLVIRREPLACRTPAIAMLEDGKLRRSAILAEGILKPKHFPTVQIDIAGIWPD